MAKQKAKSDVESSEGSEGAIAAAEKIARLLALIVTKDMQTTEAALKLADVGFSAKEVSALLDVSGNYVHAMKHRRKSTPKRRGSKAG